MTLRKLMADFEKAANPEKAKTLAGFFKTGSGEYGEGDLFLGVMVPQTRTIAKRYPELGFADIKRLLKSKYHEHRLCALMILQERFATSSETDRKKIFDFYIANVSHVNNWDLVDLSAHQIVGAYLEDRPKDILYKLATSHNLWERRIAIISTYHYIKQGNHAHALRISEILLKDKHDLIHKAVGWMLREVGKRNAKAEEKFLDKYASTMPRTMLRYAIERLPPTRRKFYMKRAN